MVEENSEFESIGIDDMIQCIDEMYPKLVERIKETATILSKTTKSNQKHI